MIDHCAGPATHSWEPILADSVAERAADSVREVAEALTCEEWDPRRVGPGIAGGNMGLAIFYDEAFRALREQQYEQSREARWNAAVDQLASDTTIPHLFAGYCGVGWGTHFLGSRTPAESGEEDPDSDSVHEELEEALLQDLEEMREPANFDLIGGAVGWGLYSLERWPHPRAHRALERIVDFLERSAESTRDGIRWWTAPHLLPPWQREMYPAGYHNLGLAHGMPAIWVLLSQAIERGVRTDVAQRLLEGSVRWVLSKKIDAGTGSWFPSMVAEGHAARPSRLAWCYGDLGIAAALFVTARCADRDDWEAEAVAIARNAAGTSFEQSRVQDAGLCHGAAGVGHVFNRMYQATGDESCLEAARFWLTRALEMRLVSGGVAGYASRRTEGDRPDGPWIWVPRPGILEGAAGVALGLLAGFTPSEPTWDRFLFLSPVPLPASSSSG